MSAVTRGRLIRPQRATIGIIDTLETSLETGDPALTDGYDEDFKEPIKLPRDEGAGGPGVTQRVERLVEVRCQVELPRVDQQRESFSGNMPQTQIILVCHFAELADAGLVDAETGEALIRIAARLVKIDTLDGKLIQNFERLNLYVREVNPASWGLSGGTRNLLLLTFEQRNQGSLG